MNIDDYRYITTIADLGSFSSAARELFITQPSLSQRVKHIENTYGITIFIREAKGVRLTPEGECFVRHAKNVLSSETDLMRELSEIHSSGQDALRIGVSRVVNNALLDQIIFRFCSEYPSSQFDLTENRSPALQQMLLSGEIDVAICYLPISSPKLKYKVLLNDRFVLVPAHGSVLAENIHSNYKTPIPDVNVKLLEGEPFAIPTGCSHLHQCLMSILEQSRIQPDVRCQGSNLPTLYSIAKSGIASTILPESFLTTETDHEPYYYLDGVSDADPTLVIAWRKDAYLSRAAKDFIHTAHKIHEENSLAIS